MSEPVGVHRVEKKRLNPWWVVHELVHWSICATVIALVVSVTFLGGRGLAAAVGGAHPNVVPMLDVVCLVLCVSGILMGGPENSRYLLYGRQTSCASANAILH